MDEQSTEELDSQNQPTEEVVNTEVVEEAIPETDSEDLELLKEKNLKLFERAKKAEAEAKLLKAERIKQEETARLKPAEKQAEPQVTLKDQYALLQAQVPADDIDEVLRYSKFQGLSVQDALKSTVVKAVLSERAEQRKTAEVANTSGSKRTTVKVTDEQLLEKVRRGEEVDPEAVAIAEINLRKKK